LIPLLSYGREQATANKKQRRLYPNGPVFGDGHAMIRSGIQATRSRPAFISRRPWSGRRD